MQTRTFVGIILIVLCACNSKRVLCRIEAHRLERKIISYIEPGPGYYIHYISVYNNKKKVYSLSSECTGNRDIGIRIIKKLYSYSDKNSIEVKSFVGITDTSGGYRCYDREIDQSILIGNFVVMNKEERELLNFLDRFNVLEGLTEFNRLDSLIGYVQIKEFENR